MDAASEKAWWIQQHMRSICILSYDDYILASSHHAAEIMEDISAPYWLKEDPKAGKTLDQLINIGSLSATG